jgi:transposase
LQRGTKTDRSDALMLARVGRLDPALLGPVEHRSRAAQLDLASLRSRDLLVSTRTKLINHVRGTLKPFGARVEKCTPEAFPTVVEEILPPELLAALGPVLCVLRELNSQIAMHDRQVEQLAASYPEVARFQGVEGVGLITALAYRLTIDDPRRFKKSRLVPAFLGLVPAKDQSGDCDPQRHITKAGDHFVRKLLVQCAHRLLGPYGNDCDVRRWGLRLAERGGSNAKKRAIVAVARKLAVVLHAMWLSGEQFKHFRVAA